MTSDCFGRRYLRSEIYNVLGRSEESKALAGQTLSAARKLNETYLVGASLRVLGVSTLRSGATQDAWEMFEEALKHLNAVDADELIVQTQLNLVDLSRHVGWWEQGLEHVQQSLEHANRLGSDLLIGNAHFYSGTLQWQLVISPEHQATTKPRNLRGRRQHARSRQTAPTRWATSLGKTDTLIRQRKRSKRL